MRPPDAPPPRRSGASGDDHSDEKVTIKGSRIAEPNGDTHPYGGAILPQHALFLKERAVDVDVARERGYRSADQKKQLERFGFSIPQRRPPALVIPLYDVFGELAGYQIRPDDPRVLQDRMLKYESRLGQKMILDVPPRVHPHLGDPTTPLVITEGPVKADAAVSAGLNTVSLLGVWGWRGTNGDGGKVLLAAFQAIAWNNRQVYMAFDSDIMLKPSVYEAMSQLADVLKLKGAHVAYVYLPSEAGQKVGADDFLAAGNTAADVVALASPELRKPPGTTVDDKPVGETFDDIPDEPGWQVLDDIDRLLDRFIIWSSDDERRSVVLWIAHTWIIDALDFTPRLALLSPVRRCGKSRVFELIKRLARRAKMQASMSASYMFRAIENDTPTLLIDEADTVFGIHGSDDENKQLRGVIDAGFERGATVGRTVGEGAGMEPKDFPVFCPVALAGIGDCLPDTITDRSVVVRMRRRMPGESVDAFRRRRVGPQMEALRLRLGSWAESAVFTVEEIANSGPELPAGIEDRAADAWEPLVAVADAAGGDWPQHAREACKALDPSNRDAKPGTSGQLLADIRSVFVEEEIFSATLVERLNELEESPWSGWRKGSGIKASDVANILREFDVRSKNIRIGDKQRKGYELSTFTDVFDRYLPPLDTLGRSVPTSQDGQRPKDTPSDLHKDSWDVGTAEAEGGDGDGNADISSRPNEREIRFWD